MPNHLPLGVLNLAWLRIVPWQESRWFLAAVLSLGSEPTHAAQSGEIAESSRGTVQISATVAARAAVTAASDVVFMRANQSQLSASVEQICVQSNSDAGFIDLTATGETNGTDFILSSHDGTTVPMTLAWTDRLGGTRSLTPGQTLRTAPDNQANCELGDASTLSMLAPATGPVRTGVITLTLAPL
jgi:hypothetical protein